MKMLCSLLFGCVLISTVAAVCVDNVSKNNPLLVPNGRFSQLTIKSCKKLLKKYPILCLEYGKDGGRCCKTCQNAPDLTCVDDFRVPSGIFPEFGDVFKSCKWLIKQTPCMCMDQNVKKSCCKSCEKIDTNAHGCNCWDKYNKKTRKGWTIFVSAKYDSNPILDKKAIANCKEFKDWYSSFCTDGNTDCCRTCQGVDHTCVDNLNWRTNAMGKKDCKDCNCHQIMQQSKGLMKKMCKQDVKGTNMPAMGAREACCHQCSRVGFPKPAGYQIDPKLENNYSAVL